MIFLKMIDNITLRVITHATEDEFKVKKALNFFLTDIEAKSEKSNDIQTEGYYGNPIIVTEVKISKKKELNKFINFCKLNLSIDDKHIIKSELNERLDENLNFFLRFDKQQAFKNKLKLISCDDAIFIKIKIKTYPKSINKAYLVLEELFE